MCYYSDYFIPCIFQRAYSYSSISRNKTSEYGDICRSLNFYYNFSTFSSSPCLQTGRCHPGTISPASLMSSRYMAQEKSQEKAISGHENLHRFFFRNTVTLGARCSWRCNGECDFQTDLLSASVLWVSLLT